MKRLLQSAAVAALLCGTSAAAYADPIPKNDDEAYSRLSRWEQHLDDRISDGVTRHWLRTGDAWRLQKQLENIELRTLDAYYREGGLDDYSARSIVDQLRNITRQLGERDWQDSGYGGQGYGGQGYGDQGPGYGGGQSYGPPPPPPPGDSYYRQGQYESDCHRGNTAAGTIFGAIAGGLIGGAASHGNGGAVAGGVILGGLLGNTLSRDIDCDDQRDAFATANVSLNGDIGRPYDWHHNGHNGTFTTVREYRDGFYVCRDFHSVSYRNGQRFDRDGTACHQEDGYWHFR